MQYFIFHDLEDYGFMLCAVHSDEIDVMQTLSNHEDKNSKNWMVIKGVECELIYRKNGEKLDNTIYIPDHPLPTK